MCDMYCVDVDRDGWFVVERERERESLEHFFLVGDKVSIPVY
jgi:hypothetical protein